MVTARQNVRIKDNLRVHWRVEGQPIAGEGTIVDLSAKGMQLILDKVFEPSLPCVLFIESFHSQQLVISKKFKMVWFKKATHKGQECIQCGGEFI